MTEEALVEEAARAISDVRGCVYFHATRTDSDLNFIAETYRPSQFTEAEYVELLREHREQALATMDEYRRYARAVLAAVEPKIRADERERAAKIAEDRNAGLDPPDGGAPTPREMCLNIAAAIRADNYGRSPER